MTPSVRKGFIDGLCAERHIVNDARRRIRRSAWFQENQSDLFSTSVDS